MSDYKFLRLPRFATHFVAVVTTVLLLHSTILAGAPRPVYDFTGDNRTDFSLLTVGAAGTPLTWTILRNPGIPGPGNAFIRQFDFGVSGNSFNPGDYFGDGKSEISVWITGTPANFWTVAFPETTTSTPVVTQFGQASDNLGRDGDYDGDGKQDFTILRVAANQLTWIYKGSGGTTRSVPFGRIQIGQQTFAFRGADFTGDGRDEIVIAQVLNSTGAATWWIGDSITGASVLTVPYANWNTDFLIQPDDYTGDGLADIPTFAAGRPGADASTWSIRNTASGQTVTPVHVFGIPDPNFVNMDLPLRGDYDGDGRADIAVFRPSTATWYWLRSSDGILGAQQWGTGGSTTQFPIPNLFTF